VAAATVPALGVLVGPGDLEDWANPVVPMGLAVQAVSAVQAARVVQGGEVARVDLAQAEVILAGRADPTDRWGLEGFPDVAWDLAAANRFGQASQRPVHISS
jgi:hypothetical protein